MKSILHLPTTVGDNPLGLSNAEKKLGYNSLCLNIFKNNKFNYKSDILPVWSFLYRFGFLGKAISLCLTFLKYRKRFDVYHFNLGHSLIDHAKWNINYIDLPFYKKSSKIIVTFNGCDARQKRSNKIFTSCETWNEEISYNHLYGNDVINKIKTQRIKKFDKYADHIFTVNPDLFKFLPERTKFLPYSIASWDDIKCMGSSKIASNKKIKIVHAPTNRDLKGSKFIIESLTKIKRKYSNVEISLVENMKHQDALKEYKEADLVIDQLLIGWYGAFAVEVMKMGKPVMVFIRKSDLKYIDKKMAQDCLDSFITVDPTNLYEKLCLYLDNPAKLREISKASVEYVNKWHDPLKIAKYVSQFY